MRQLLANGRHWQASVELRARFERTATVSMPDRLLLAEAEAGWRNWEGVLEALAPNGTVPPNPPPRYWLLLGRAREAAGDGTKATAALARFAEEAPADHPNMGAALSWLVRVGALGRPVADTEADIAKLRSRFPAVADWTALDAGRRLSVEGRPAETHSVLRRIRDPSVRRRGWNLVVDAWLAAQDTAKALASLNRLTAADDGRPSRLDLASRRWRYQLALADTAASVSSMTEVIGATTRGPAALVAAKALRAHGRNLDVALLRRMASALANGGEYGPALQVWRAAVEAGATLTDREGLARARALAGSGERPAAVREYRRLSVSADTAIAASALVAWAAIRRRQGRHGDVRILEDRLVERYPSRGEAVDVVFFRADDDHDAGRVSEALRGYRQVAAMSPSADKAGLARMRWGQIHLARGEAKEAAEVFAAYLAEFPQGRRWEEASFWAARAAEAVGDTAAARRHAVRIRRESPLSYYAALAPEGPQGAYASLAVVPDGPGVASPAWLVRELDVLAALDEAELAEGAAAHVRAMTAAVRDSDALLFALAVALGNAGRVRDGISLGWELRERGRPWDAALLRLVFPFPHRALIETRAEELNLDPFLVAGVIRQESAFDPLAVSSAGAVGLMQVLPATGRQLARSAGPRRFSRKSLTTPELNVHLGALFLSELMERYDGDVPLALSAYNAGPTRANRWRRFPESEDPRRFTERIPFSETRQYVKNVRRNRILYAWLYGGAPGPA